MVLGGCEIQILLLWRIKVLKCYCWIPKKSEQEEYEFVRFQSKIQVSTVHLLSCGLWSFSASPAIPYKAWVSIWYTNFSLSSQKKKRKKKKEKNVFYINIVCTNRDQLMLSRSLKKKKNYHW